MCGLRLPSASVIRPSSSSDIESGARKSGGTSSRGTKSGDSNSVAPPRWYLAVLVGLFAPLTVVERSFTAGAGQSVWTPALGIVFGIMVLYGTRWVPVLVGTLIGVTAINAAISSTPQSTDWATISALVAVIVIGYAIGAEIARRARIQWSLRRLSDAVWLGVGALTGTAIAIATAIEVVKALGYLHGQALWPMFVKGSASAGASTLAISPLLLLLGDRVTDRHPGLSASLPRPSALQNLGSIAESLVVAGSFAGAAHLALAHSSPGYYPMLVPIGWLALRRGIAGTSVGVAVGSLALSLFAHSQGLKVGRINQLEIFLLVFAACGLAFGSAQSERRDLENEAIRGRQALAAREAELKLLVETLQDQANRDTLTHLPLKSLFVEYLVQAQARVRRTGRLVAVLYLDVDGFKLINDRYGHRIGDTAISILADRLRRTVRVLDSPARAYEGGDEFLILCDQLANADEGYAIADRIASAVAAPFEIPGAGTFTLTASVGVAFAGPHDEPDAVVERADAAMLEAKAKRDRAEQYSAGELTLVLEP